MRQRISIRLHHLSRLVMITVAMAVFLGCTGNLQNIPSPEYTVEKELFRDMTAEDDGSIAEIPWRVLFSDPELQSLISEALENNLDLKVALARIKKARANAKQSKSALFPSVDITAGTIQQITGTDDATSYEEYNLYAGAAWEADIWGKLRSTEKANLALLMESEAYKKAVQTQLIADVATNYYKLLAYDEKLQITEKTVGLRKESVEAIRLLKESNVVTGAAVVQSEANRYSAEVTIPDLKKSIYETENTLSLLLGRTPDPIRRTPLDRQALSLDLKIGIPAQLLANRPDVQEAEYRLRYYTEMTDVARSYFYPSLTLSAQAGFSNTDLSDWFDGTSLFRNLIGNIVQPVFNQGKNKQRLEVARANQEEYIAAFKQALLSAGKEVSNALFDYQTATEKMAIRANQIEYLEKAVEYTKELLKYTSSTNYTDVLTSEQGLLAAQLSRTNDKLQQLEALVDLYRSLGGGWK